MISLAHGRVFLDKSCASEPFFTDLSQIFESSLLPSLYELDPFEFTHKFIEKSPTLHAQDAEGKEITQLSPSTLLLFFEANLPRFRLLFNLYADLSKAGWTIRRGINYGADFLLYDDSPDTVHSRFALFLGDSSKPLSWNTILALNRVCVTAKKTMILAVPTDEPGTSFKFIQMNRWVPESNRE